MTVPASTRFFRYTALLLGGWTLLCLCSLAVGVWDHRREAFKFALETARASLEKDLVYRRWNARHGGVYVPVSNDTPPNPYLSKMPDRDLTTADGTRLTLVNPAYMTRQVHELARQDGGVLAHITSLRPLRPENGPDPWEREALLFLANGATEISAISPIEGRPHMRVMIPLRTEEPCLKCHAAQGYQAGDQRGGLSASVPLPDPWRRMFVQHWMGGLVLLLIWGSGTTLLLAGSSRLRRQLGREAQTVRALKNSEERYRMVVDHIDAIVWELDLSNFCFTFVSNHAETLLGYPLADWLGPSFWLDHLHPDDRFGALHYCLERTQSGENHSFEYRMLTRDGRTIWLLDLVTVEKVDGHARILRGLMFDVTEKKQVELQLQEYRKAVEASLDLVFSVDRDFRYVLVSQAFLAFAKKEHAAVIGKSVAEVFGMQIHGHIRPYLDQCLAGQTVSFETEYPEHPSGPRWLLCVYTPVVEQEQVTRVVGVLHDITDIKNAQRSLVVSRQLAEDANRMKSEFLANMSHELRTPLNGILGMVQLLDTTELSEEQQEYVNVASKSGWNLLALLNDLLDLSCIEAGKLPLKRREFDLTALMAGMEQTFASQLSEQHLGYTCAIAADVPVRIVGDEVRLRQILLNLVGNAIKFTPAGKVACTVRRGGRSPDGALLLEFKISDTGIGIQADLQEKIFEPFVQGESVYRKRYQGAGLGLAIVGKLLSLLEGMIYVDSTPGVGTTVTVTLPFSEPSTPAAASSIPAAADVEPDHELRILVAEDNAVNRYAIEQQLKFLDHRVTVVENGREALACLAADDFDMVLMDIQMPIMDGVEALRLIRSGEHGVRNPHIPVIAMTAYAMIGDREVFLSAGMNDYMSKPIFTNDLRECLTRNRAVRG